MECPGAPPPPYPPPLVHHHCPLRVVDTVQGLHLIAHIHRINIGTTSRQVVPRAIAARIDTMINHLGDMIPSDRKDDRGYGLVVFHLVALPLIRIVLRDRDRLWVPKISVVEPQRITSAPPAASSQEPKKEADEDGGAQGWSVADA